MRQIVTNMGHTRYLKDKYMIKCNDIAEEFFIVLEGHVSVWVPIKPKMALKPLHKLRQNV